MRQTVRRIAELFPTAIISGRGREKVQAFVQLPELYYAGSHGLDIAGPRLQVRCRHVLLCPMRCMRDTVRLQWHGLSSHHRLASQAVIVSRLFIDKGSCSSRNFGMGSEHCQVLEVGRQCSGLPCVQGQPESCISHQPAAHFEPIMDDVFNILSQRWAWLLSPSAQRSAWLASSEAPYAQQHKLLLTVELPAHQLTTACVPAELQAFQVQQWSITNTV